MRVTTDTDISQALAETVKTAAQKRTPLVICGGGTKRFHTGDYRGDALDVTGHRGIVSYDSTELVITARAGTPLAEIEATLTEKNQMLGFEPPAFGTGATLGGTIACGLSGPRRPYAGAARDFVLGTKIINGQGNMLKFGGEVMKNVAGYDVSRLMAGARGALGVLLEVSLKVLPKPAQEITLSFEMPADSAITTMCAWGGQSLPLSAAAHLGDTLYVRLSGVESSLRAARAKLGGERMDKGDAFWREMREHQRGFFQDETPLWRLSVPPATSPLPLEGHWLIDWGGAQRWLKSSASSGEIRDAAQSAGGYAALFRGDTTNPVSLSAPDPALARIQKSIKQAFDPLGILNVISDN